MKALRIINLPIVLSVAWALNTNAQIFLEQAEEWGVDATVTAQEWGSGVSTYDFNQDGLDDITLVTDDGNILFYENVAGNSFQLVNLGIPSPTGFAKQLIWVDFDDDYDLDIFISTYFGKVKLYRNNGDFSFEDVTESAGLPNVTAPNYGAAFGDYDNDGDLDLHLTRYYLEIPPPENPDEQPNLWSRLYRNDGDGTFTDVTLESNFYFDPVVAFQSVWFDLDNDNDQDNFVIVDRSPGNHLFKNENDDFVDVTDQYGVSYPGNDFMSNSVADYNNDGFLDIFMTNSGSTFANTPSVLFKNDGGLSLLDVSVSVGMQIYDFGWGATWADVDNNGWKDLFFVTDDDFEHNNLYMNNGGIFSDAHDQIITESDYPCFSVARGDFNKDGYYDLAVQGMAPNPTQLLINNGSDNKWIKFQVAGTVSNSMGIGSTIHAYVGQNLYMEYIFCGENYISQNSQNQIIGIGSAQIVDSLKVTYLSGHTDVYYDLLSDSTYFFTEGETYSVEISASDTAVCAGESIVLNAGNHDEYLWSTGETSSQISVNSSGLYSVQTTNEFGVTSSDSIFVSVNPLPEIAVSTSLNPCNGDSLATIQLSNNTGIEVDSVVWNNGYTGAFIDSLTAGEYSYQYLDINGCSAEGNVIITDPPVMTVFAETSPSDPDGSNGSIFISVFGGVGPYIITLSGDTVGTQISGLAPGVYTVLITDSSGCVKTVEVEVDSTLGLNFEESEALKVYPIPVENELRIISSLRIDELHILNTAGQIEMSVENPSKKIDVSQLKPGVYILIFKSENSSLIRKRIVKV
jgi:hypothetical protein